MTPAQVAVKLRSTGRFSEGVEALTPSMTFNLIESRYMAAIHGLARQVGLQILAAMKDGHDLDDGSPYAELERHDARRIRLRMRAIASSCGIVRPASASASPSSIA